MGVAGAAGQPDAFAVGRGGLGGLATWLWPTLWGYFCPD